MPANLRSPLLLPRLPGMDCFNLTLHMAPKSQSAKDQLRRMKGAAFTKTLGAAVRAGLGFLTVSLSATENVN